jgi:hypothetical protein
MLLLIAPSLTCCTLVSTLSFRGVECDPPEVIAWVPLSSYSGKSVCVFKFDVPVHAKGAAEWLSRIYIEKLMQEGPFRSVRPLEANVSADGEAIRLGHAEQCDLVILPTVVSLIESSGAMPTELKVDVRLLDVAMSRLLIRVGQRAASEPGQDIDLVWSIVEAQPALRTHQLAQRLALQYARLLASAAGPAAILGGK